MASARDRPRFDAFVGACDIKGVGELVGFNPHIIDEVPAAPGIYVLYDVSDRP